MTPAPVARYLREFGPDGDAGKQQKNGLRWDPRPSEAEMAARRIEEAFARGQEEGRVAAKAECDLQLQRERHLMEERLAHERQAWIAEEAEKISAQLATGLHELETRLAEAVAGVLKPFLVAEVRRQAEAELVALIRSLVGKQEGVRLEISGPGDLLEALRKRLTGLPAHVTFAETNEADVRVVSDSTILETNVGAWVASLEEART